MVEMVNTLINGQWELMLPYHRAMRREWKLIYGGWEKERLLAINDCLKKDEIFFYCGSEEGELCGLISMWGGQLILIEPNVKAWPNTKIIYETNNLAKPLVSFVGFVSNKSSYKKEDIIYNGFPKCSTDEIVSDHGFCELHNSDIIPQIKIDDLVKETLLIPKHISMDCEGSEFEIIRGAENTIVNHKPVLWLSIHPEFMFNHWNEYSGDLRNYIKKFGYKEKILDYQHELHCVYFPL